MLFSLRQWSACLKQYLLMSLFLSSPDRLPARGQYIPLTFLAYFLTGLLLVDEQRGYLSICAQIVYEQLLLFIIVWSGLKLSGYLSRLQQSYSALLGVNLIISLATIAIFHLTDSTDPGNGFVTVTLLVIFWNLAVLSLLFKRSFEISTPAAAMVAFSFFMFYQFSVFWVM
ncbi:MAG: hypothetical protein ACI822_001010 [Gammaproteobacteria bacterium]|jgi:hypothetical protein